MPIKHPRIALLLLAGGSLTLPACPFVGTCNANPDPCCANPEGAACACTSDGGVVTEFNNDGGVVCSPKPDAGTDGG